MPALVAAQPGARLLLFGGGPMEMALKAQAAASPLADRVHFVRRVPMATPMLIATFLNVAGVFVVAYGLLPRNFVARRGAAVEMTISALKDAATGDPPRQM